MRPENPHREKLRANTKHDNAIAGKISQPIGYFGHCTPVISHIYSGLDLHHQRGTHPRNIPVDIGPPVDDEIGGVVVTVERLISEVPTELVKERRPFSFQP